MHYDRLKNHKRYHLMKCYLSHLSKNLLKCFLNLYQGINLRYKFANLYSISIPVAFSTTKMQTEKKYGLVLAINDKPFTWCTNANFLYIYKYKFTIENKKTKKDIHQASKHLRMPGTNLKTIKFNNI